MLVRGHPPERWEKAARLNGLKQCTDTMSSNSGPSAASIKGSEKRIPYTITASPNQFKDQF